MKSTKERKERSREHQQEKGSHEGEKKGRGSKDRNSISFRIS
jgi:hypothetical protein